MADPFELLGAQIAREAMGAEGEGGGFNWGMLANAAGELVNRGVSTYEQQQAADKAKADIAQRTTNAISKDAAWAGAEATLDLAASAPVKDQQRIAAAQAMASSAAASAAMAGAGLPQFAMDKRIQTARQAAEQAAQESFAAPGDTAKAARMRAWQKVALAAASPLLPAGAQLTLAQQQALAGQSFWTKMHGPLPGWGWVAGGTVVGGGLIWLVVSLARGKRK